LLAAQLVDGHQFILGEQFSLADAACYHPVWFLRNFPPAAVVFDEFPQVVEWSERIKAMGHGKRADMSAEEALQIAHNSTPTNVTGTDPREPNGISPGAQVTVTLDDYAFDPVAGEVVTSSVHEIAIRRRDDRVGEVVAHFPSIGFRVQPQ